MTILDIFKDHLEKNLPKVNSFHPYYNQALSYTLKSGGKHFRAQLFLGTIECFNKDLLMPSLDVALAIEMIHTYSLIHDDLPCMDNAKLRRGKDTLHIKYDEVTALLVGDALNTHAFNIIANSNLTSDTILKCIKILSKNAGIDGMVLGQAIDCYFENKKLNLSELEFLHIHKTGALIAACLQMAGEICQFKDTESLYDLGIKLGLVFQIYDDILDYTQTSEKAGKTTNADKNKNSFVNLLGLEKSQQYATELKEEILVCSKAFGEYFKKMILNLINKYL